MANNIGDWIMTYTGKKMYPLSPCMDDIDIVDIAHALSLKCRFTGHCSEFYSVAQHSCRVAMQCPDEHKLAGLLHDAAEAYLPDVSRPIKPYLYGFEAIEENLLQVIFAKFGLPYPFDGIIKDIDTRMCLTEGIELMPDTTDWGIDLEPFSTFESPLMFPRKPKSAERQFLYFFQLFGDLQEAASG